VKGGGRAAGSDIDADSDGDDDDDEPAPKRKPAKRQKRAGADEEGGSSRKGTGFGKPLPLSDEFAAACGKPAMNRGEISKWLFDYCKEHDLKVG
jgi:chromatin remodeling complex protein RSC6